MKKILIILSTISFLAIGLYLTDRNYLDRYLSDELGGKHDWMSLQDSLGDPKSDSVKSIARLEIIRRGERCVLRIRRKDRDTQVLLLTPSNNIYEIKSMTNSGTSPQHDLTLIEIGEVRTKAERSSCRVSEEIWENMIELAHGN